MSDPNEAEVLTREIIGAVDDALQPKMGPGTQQARAAIYKLCADALAKKAEARQLDLEASTRIITKRDERIAAIQADLAAVRQREQAALARLEEARRLLKEVLESAHPSPDAHLSMYAAWQEARAFLARKDQPEPPGMTDLMVSPESLDAYLDSEVGSTIYHGDILTGVMDCADHSDANPSPARLPRENPRLA